MAPRNLPEQSSIPPTDRAGEARRWAIILLIGANMAGCALLKPSPPSACESCQAQQTEIERLQQLLADKDALIRNQQAHQKEQARELQESSSEVARAQIRLRRMAAQTDAALAVAEVEVAMEKLNAADISPAHQALRTLAQHLLDTANAAYTERDFAAAVERAAQSRGIIDMLWNMENGQLAAGRRVTVSFQSPIPLRTRTKSNLRQSPTISAKRVTVLQQDTALVSLGYRGDWLSIQTEEGLMGWIFNTLVEARTETP
jgi:hypothetical protein